MILVTGGTGFLGSTLIKHLIHAGEQVIATKRSSSTVPQGLRDQPALRWAEADITDYFALADLFEGVSKVYHCAAQISYQPGESEAMLHSNIEGTKHIANLCLEHQARLVHVSSIASLGPGKNGMPATENCFWDDGAYFSKYSLSKYESEMQVWRAVAEGLDAVIVNPSIIMGAGAADRGAGKLFMVVNKGLKVYPTGSVGIVDVEDVARLMILLMEDRNISGERFILNSENISNKDLLTAIAKLLHKPAPAIAAKPFLMSVAWRAAKLLSLISRKPPSITKDTARASSSKMAYSNQKIIKATGYSFKAVDLTLKEMSLDYI